MILILDDNQTTSAEFTASQQFGFVISATTQGGTWIAADAGNSGRRLGCAQ